MSSFVLAILLYISGAAIFLMEILLPGFILMSIGIVIFLAFILLCFKAYGVAGGLFSLFAVLMTVIFEIYYIVKRLPDTWIGKKAFLKGKIETVAVKEKEELIGKEGIAITDLRPAGTIKIDGKRYDVISETDYVKKGTKVEVIDTKGLKIMVRPKEGL